MVNTWLVGARRMVAGAGATTWWSLNGEKGVLCCANCRRNRSNRGRGDTNGLGRGPNHSLMALEHDPPLFSNHILQRIGRGGFFFSSWSLWLRAEFQIYPLTYLHCDWRVTGIILLSPISSRVRANVERMHTDMAPRTLRDDGPCSRHLRLYETTLHNTKSPVNIRTVQVDLHRAECMGRSIKS